jgi:hypothetical protein
MQNLLFRMAAVAAVGTMLLAAAPAAATDPGAKPDQGGCSAAATVPAGDPAAVEITYLQPFTNIEEIPVGSDLASIKLAGIKAVKVATTRTSITDQSYCENGFQEPGGSMYCPSVQDGSQVAAYQVTYSYVGPLIGSDEYGSNHFTFSVILRPEDLDPAVSDAISAHRMSRAVASEGLKLTTYRGLVQRVVIDEANSAFCDGNYIDGLWTHTDRNCREKVAYKTVAVPSDYITVRVDSTARMANLSSASHPSSPGN